MGMPLCDVGKVCDLEHKHPERISDRRAGLPKILQSLPKRLQATVDSTEQGGPMVGLRC